MDIWREEAKLERRREALMLVDGHLCLQELIADMNDADREDSWKEFEAIARYINERYDGHESAEEIADFIFEQVYEDKEKACILWRNDVTNRVRKWERDGYCEKGYYVRNFVK